MRSYPNIEKSVFHRSQYIGYSNGAWRIWRWSKKGSAFAWIAIKQHAAYETHTEIFGRTLAEISEKLTVYRA